MRNKGYLGAYLRGQKSRLGAPEAITATAQKLARIVYNVMRFGVEYVAEHQKRMEKNLQRRAKELGYVLVKIEQTARAEPQHA